MRLFALTCCAWLAATSLASAQERSSPPAPIVASEGFGARTVALRPHASLGETPIEAVCGFKSVTSADTHFVYAGGARRMSFVVRTSGPALLLVSSPDGRWLCGTPNETGAAIVVNPALSGRYGIWLGASTQLESATLAIEELNDLPEGGVSSF